MNNILVENLIRYVVLMLLQVLILNNIYLGPGLTPFLYVLFILMLPTSLAPLWMLLIGFISGLGVDISLNMLGFHACCATLVAFCRVVFGNKILTRGDDVVIETPCMYTVATQQYFGYVLLMLLIYHLAFFLLESFSFHHLGRLLLATVIDTLVTWVLVLIYQSLFLRRKKV